MCIRVVKTCVTGEIFMSKLYWIQFFEVIFRPTSKQAVNCLFFYEIK